MYLQRFTRDHFSLFEHTPGSLQAPTNLAAPVADAGEEEEQQYWTGRVAYTQWMARDATAPRAVRAHLPLAQRAHFRQVMSAQTFNDTVVRHYSSLSSATLGRLSLPFLLPDLSSLACGGGGSSGGQQQQQQQQRQRPLFWEWQQLSSLACIEEASVGACETARTDGVPPEALNTFTLESGVSRCFFRDCTTVTPLTAPTSVTLADPFSGPIVARSSTVLPCPAAPSGSLTGFHLLSFATNLRSTGDPRLILGKVYRLVVLGGYGRTDPLLNKPFFPNGLVVGILAWF
ncbi:unnamed protein product [Closterium sp. NIES-53]